jgi:S1-C subfamily serine protease
MPEIQSTTAQAWSDAPSLILRLSESLDSFDWAAAESTCQKLIGRLNQSSELFPRDPAKVILARLRRKRQFRLMELVADALIRSGQRTPQILRQYAQAMIDQGNLLSPEIILGALLADPETSQGERAEANGLLGRIYKQLYVNGADSRNPRQQDYLRKSLHHYYDVYNSDRTSYMWHGINVVALLARARRDKVNVGVAEDDNALAKQILSEIEKKSDTEGVYFWDRAIMVEANVALDRFEEATSELIYFVSDANADAFETSSLYRQLTEVWQISNSSPCSDLLNILRAAHLKSDGGELQLKQADITKGLQAVFGRDRYEAFSWLQRALKRCTGIARIEDPMGTGRGSGFLIDGSEFFDPAGIDPLLLTNYHVINAHGDGPGLQPDKSVAFFEALNTRYKVKKILWSSEIAMLDASLVSLERIDSQSSLCSLKPAADPFKAGEKQRVYVIGYPLGGSLSISLHDSEWLDCDDRRLHYRTPTEPGSSGSPVFDQRFWTVIGLHHRGLSEMPRQHGQGGTYQANEAISIGAIHEAIRQSGVRPS